MASIDTPLLVMGHGPAALVLAKIASGMGFPSVVAGHEAVDDREPVVLDDRSQTILRPHGVLGVLRPYAVSQEPFAIAPIEFENGLKHHCVADMLITVLDGIEFEGQAHGGPITGSLSDGRSTWEVSADVFVDAGTLPGELNEAIRAAAELAESLVPPAS